MWLGGVLLLLIAVVAVVTWIGRSLRSAPSAPLWDIPAVASTYTGIVGALAGFTVASTVFLANRAASRNTEAFAVTMGMFLVAFIGFLVASQMFGTLPNRAPAEDAGANDDLDQRLGFLLAIVGYYVGLSISWLGLRPLLIGLMQRALADVFAWLLLVAVFAGAARLGVFLYRLTTVPSAACLAVPLLGFGAAAAYRLLAVPFVPSLWPKQDAALAITLVVAGLAGFGFAAETAMLAFHGDARLRTRLPGPGQRVVLAYVQAVVAVVALLWFAVAMG